MAEIAVERTLSDVANVEALWSAEDLIFFLKHLEKGGRLKKVDKNLLIYRYHDTNLSPLRSLSRLFATRLSFFERRVLSTPPWQDGFVVWGAGKGGQEFVDNLSYLNYSPC